MPDAATALQILSGAANPLPASSVPGQSQASADGGSEPFNSAEWTPAPLGFKGTRSTGFTPTDETHGFENKRTGEWMLNLPSDGGAIGANGGNGSAAASDIPWGANDPAALGDKLAILSLGADGKLRAPGGQFDGKLTGAAANFGAGASDAIAGALGAPVDAATWALNQGHRLMTSRSVAEYNDPNRAPWIQNPLGGSESIKSGMGLVGADPRDVVPADSLDAIARGAGAGVAGTVLPMGAARAVAGGVPALSLRGYAPTSNVGKAVLGGLSQPGLPTAAAIGAGAGAGGTVAENLVPDPYKPLANLGGQLVAGGLTGGAIAAGRSAVGAATRLAGDYVAPFT
jgi:hypothetical protein